MKKRVFVIAAIVSGALAVSGCTTNPYTGEREAGKSGIGAGIGSLVGAGIGALSSSKKDRGKGALIGAAAVRPLAAVSAITWTCRKQNCATKCRNGRQRDA
jgi:outer membrane lipoprotein SlyB